MTLWGEIQKEATTPTTLLSTRKTLTIRSWNIRTMYKAGKTTQVAAEMHSYKLAVLGLSETRWQQARQMRLATGELLLYSKHEEDSAAHTSLMLSREADRALIGWKAHGPWMITSSFKTIKKNIKLNIIQCYAPTNNSSEDMKDHFYGRLQAVLDKRKGKDVNILMGEFNAKIGADNTGYEEVIGSHALGEINENREKFATSVH